MAGAIWGDEHFEAAEHAIYEAAVLPELWPEVLGTLGTVSNSAGGALLCINERGPHLLHAPALDAVARRFMDEQWYLRNGRASGAMARGLVGGHRFINEDDYFAEGEADRDAMVVELFRPEGFGWAAGFMQQLPHGDVVVINVEQYFERGPIRGDDLARLDSLYPHLSRATILAARADLERVRTAIETLEALGLPAAALSPSRRVTVANSWFEQTQGLFATGLRDRLHLTDRTADALLGTALETLRQQHGPRSIPVRRAESGDLAGVLQVIPIRRRAHDVFGSSAAILVLAERRGGVPDTTLLHAMFDLTPAEIAVAQGLAEGKSPTELALQSGRSLATIRNQIKSAMQKTGCTRQTELALMVRSLTGPLAG